MKRFEIFNRHTGAVIYAGEGDRAMIETHAALWVPVEQQEAA